MEETNCYPAVYVKGKIVKKTSTIYTLEKSNNQFTHITPQASQLHRSRLNSPTFEGQGVLFW